MAWRYIFAFGLGAERISLGYIMQNVNEGKRKDEEKGGGAKMGKGLVNNAQAAKKAG